MKFNLKHLWVMIGWGIIISAIVFLAFVTPGREKMYAEPGLELLDWILLFAVSVYAGMLLVEPDVVVPVYFGAFGLSLVIVFACMTLPATIGVLVEYPALKEAVIQQAIVLIVRTLIPFPLVFCFVSGLIGAFIGERFKLG